jgi:hypothetical protein
MPISVAKLLKLKLAEDDPVISYWLRLPDEPICEALILTRREACFVSLRRRTLSRSLPRRRTRDSEDCSAHGWM